MTMKTVVLVFRTKKNVWVVFRWVAAAGAALLAAAAVTAAAVTASCKKA
jgi:hypothetical protein